MTARGCRIVSVDPLYRHSPAEIRSRFDAALPAIISRVRSTPGDWVWNYHHDLEGLEAGRREAMKLFLSDYDVGLREFRYVAGQLPTLPFEDAAFGCALCSHFLFLYSALLPAEFHVQSVRELCRVARDVRIFPLLALDRQFSPHVAAVRSAAASKGWESDIIHVEYEFLLGANQMLRIFRP